MQMRLAMMAGWLVGGWLGLDLIRLTAGLAGWLDRTLAKGD
jgi:hypothetical protein